MLQVVEFDEEKFQFLQGPGQLIETKLAAAVGTKVFRMLVRGQWTQQESDLLASAMEEWRREGCIDSSLQELSTNERPLLLMAAESGSTENVKVLMRKGFRPGIGVDKRYLGIKNKILKDQSKNT